MDRTGRGKCDLGLFGGKPWLGNCNDCIKQGWNTPEGAARIFDTSKSHPANAPRTSGCCDSAENY